MPILDQLLQYHSQRKSPLEMLKESRRARMEEGLALEQLTMQRESHQAQKDKAAAEAEADKRAAQAVQKAVQYVQQSIGESGQPDFVRAKAAAYADGNPDAIAAVTEMQNKNAVAQRGDQGIYTDIESEKRAKAGEGRAIEDQKLQQQAEGRAADNFNFEKGLRGTKAAQAQATLENTIREGKKKDLELKEGPEYKVPASISEGTLKAALAGELDKYDLKSTQKEELLANAVIAYSRLVSADFKNDPEKALEVIKQSIADTTTESGIMPWSEGTANPAKFMEQALTPPPSPEDIARMQQDANDPNIPEPIRSAIKQKLQELGQ